MVQSAQQRPGLARPISLSRPSLGPEEEAQVLEVLRSGRLTRGPKVEEFEQRVARRLDVEHAVAVSSGTAALHLALLAMGVGPGDEVLVPDFTFPAPANAVRHCGAEPVLLDIDLDTFNLSVEALRAFLATQTVRRGGETFNAGTGRRIRAVIPVHQFGLPADLPAVSALAERHALAVLEDAACAIGAQIGGRACGTLGQAGVFSFHPRKLLTTGEGGIVVTRDAALAEAVRRLRNHGMVAGQPHAQFTVAGFNYRLSDLHAAIGIAQMDRLEPLMAAHRTVAGWYDAELEGVAPVRRPTGAPGRIYQAYVTLLAEGVDRDAVVAGMLGAGVECALGTYAVSAQPAFAGGAACPNSAAAQRRSLALPMHAGLDRDDVRYVCDALKRLAGG